MGKTIREMCEEFEVTPRTLRFYEDKELISPVRIGTKRLFTKACCGRLKLILRGKRFGFSLEEIRQLLNLYDADDQQLTQMVRTHEIGIKHYDAMVAQRDELDAAIADFRSQLDQVEKTLREAGLLKAAEQTG